MNKSAIKILKNPRITEKATFAYEGNVYTFDVVPGASKNEIKQAVFELYKVKPTKVNTVKVPTKKVRLRGRVGKKSGGRKAYVFLAPGDKIEFI